MALSPYMASKYATKVENIKATTEVGINEDVRYSWKGSMIYIRRCKRKAGSDDHSDDMEMKKINLRRFSANMQDGTIVHNFEDEDVDDEEDGATWKGDEIQTPIFRHSSYMFYVFIASEIFLTLTVFFFDMMPFIVLALQALLAIYLAFAQYTAPKSFVKEYFGDRILNYVFKLKTDTGFSKYLESIPTWLFCGTFLFKLGAMLVYSSLPKDPSVTIASCGFVEHCSSNESFSDMCYDRFANNKEEDDTTDKEHAECDKISALSSICIACFATWLLLAFVETFLLLSLRSSMSEPAKHAISYESEKLEATSKICEQLICDAEMRVVTIKKFRVTKRTKFIIVIIIALLSSLIRFIQVLNDIFRHHHFDAATTVLACFGSLFVCLSAGVAIVALCYASYATWAIYQACYLRMRTLSNFLDDNHKSWEFGTKELQDWWNVRCYYTDIVLPVSYQMTNFWLGVSVILAIMLFLGNLIATFVLLQVSHSAASVISFLWYGYSLCGICFVSTTVALKRAESILTEQERQVECLQRESLYLTFQGDQDNDNPSIAQKQLVIAQLLEHMAKFDKSPRVLGIKVTPLLVQSVSSYMVSGITLIILALLRDGMGGNLKQKYEQKEA